MYGLRVCFLPYVILYGAKGRTYERIIGERDVDGKMCCVVCSAALTQLSSSDCGENLERERERLKGS